MFNPVLAYACVFWILPFTVSRVNWHLNPREKQNVTFHVGDVTFDGAKIARCFEKWYTLHAMKEKVSSEIAVLQEITTVVVRERNVRILLEQVLEILERRMGMLRGTFTLLEGDELRIEASTKQLNAEERALGRYRIGEGITGLVAKTGRAEIVLDVRKDKRFLNRTRSRGVSDPLSFVCVPLIHLGQVIGTLSVDREMRGDTASLGKDVALLQIIANMTAEAAAICREEHAEREALMAENRKLRDMVMSDNPGQLIGNSRGMLAVY